MSINEEIRECCIQSHKNWLWQKQEEGEIPKEEETVKEETKIDNKYIYEFKKNIGSHCDYIA